MPTPTDINKDAKVSEYLAGNDIAKGALFGKRVTPNLNKIIYQERRSLAWMLGQDPNYSTLQQVANYVFWLCGKYQLKAQAIIAGGAGGIIIVPTTPSSTSDSLFFIIVRKADFANATDYVNAELDGQTLAVFGNWIPTYLNGLQWEPIIGGGVRILISGFDSSAFDDNDIILKVDIRGVLSVAPPTSNYSYNLTADTTIASLPTGNDYQVRTVSVIPNGFAYSWASTFIFNLTWPEQTQATGVNTQQIYIFQYVPGEGDVCIGQSLDVPI
jgi:hypothetical protein